MITVGVESFRAALPELEKILPDHQREFGLFPDRMPLVWDTRYTIERDERGQVLLVVLRWNGEFAGYTFTEIGPVAQYSTTQRAISDMIYICERFRGHGLILPLMRATERELRRRRIKLWFSAYMLHNELGMPLLFERLGFAPCETSVAKWLGGT